MHSDFLLKAILNITGRSNYIPHFTKKRWKEFETLIQAALKERPKYKSVFLVDSYKVEGYRMINLLAKARVKQIWVLSEDRTNFVVKDSPKKPEKSKSDAIRNLANLDLGKNPEDSEK